MRRRLFSLFLILISYASYGQCAGPEVSSWHFSDSANVDIAFIADDSAESYEMIFHALYDGVGANGWVTLSDTVFGASVSGFNSTSFNVTDLLNQAFISLEPNGQLSIVNYYYKVELRTSCFDQGWSDETIFYVSPFSLLNDPGFFLDGDLQMPIQYLSQGAGFVVSVDIEIPEQFPPVMIDELGLFVDIGHSYNGDLSIFLTSPSGTTISLLEFPNGLGDSDGMSYYFTDEGVAISTQNTSGLVAPSQLISNFEGEIASGVWTVDIVDNLSGDYGFVFGVGLAVNTSPCVASFSGSSYYDFNSNGIEDGSDVPFSYALIEDTENEYSLFSNGNGQFIRCIVEGPGALSILNTPLYYESQPTEIIFNAEQGDEISGLDFSMTPLGDVKDMVIDIWNYIPDRPGFDNLYSGSFKNIGTTCIDDVHIEIEVDPLLEITEVNADYFSIDGNTITINLGTVCPFESGSFSFHHYLSDTVSLGTLLSTTAAIYPLAGDENVVDNTYRLDSEVVGSYDPNDKQVNHELIDADFLDNHEQLKYLVRFQNTGTFMAENVVVTDTLDELLDMSTFHILGTSHDMNITVEGRVLHFNFDDIMLPDSTADFDGSNGFLRYSIAPYDNLSEGMVIENTAHIYFDFNAAIITNTTHTIVDFTSGISEVQYEVDLFPNPVQTTFTITRPNGIAIKRVLIYGISGKNVLAEEIGVSQEIIVLDVSQLTPGSYIVYFLSDIQIKPVRLIKM